MLQTLEFLIKAVLKLTFEVGLDNVILLEKPATFGCPKVQSTLLGVSDKKAFISLL